MEDDSGTGKFKIEEVGGPSGEEEPDLFSEDEIGHLADLLNEEETDSPQNPVDLDETGRFTRGTRE